VTLSDKLLERFSHTADGLSDALALLVLVPALLVLLPPVALGLAVRRVALWVKGGGAWR
jgi:hypothetical protein